MLGGFGIGAVCNLLPLSRPKRAIGGWLFLFMAGNAIMGGGLTFENLRGQSPLDFIEFHSGQYVGPVSDIRWSGMVVGDKELICPQALLYFFYGMLDALWQGVSAPPSELSAVNRN